MATPSQYPEWATNLINDPTTNAENKLEPTQEFKDSGLLREELLPRAFLNYQLDLIRQWIQDLDERVSALEP